MTLSQFKMTMVGYIIIDVLGSFLLARMCHQLSIRAGTREVKARLRPNFC